MYSGVLKTKRRYFSNPPSESDIEEMRQFVNKWGPSNCWTGVSGKACWYLRMLLEDLEMKQ